MSETDPTQAPEEVQASQTDTPVAPERASEGGEQAGYFDEKFDPSNLPDELRPAYKQMRDSFSLKTQSLAEMRRNPTELAQALKGLDEAAQLEVIRDAGYDVPDDDTDDFEFEDYGYDEDEPEVQFDPRVDALLEDRQQQELAAQKQAFERAQWQHMDKGFDALETNLGRSLTENEVQVVARMAQTPEFLDEHGMPDIRAAHSAWDDAFSERQKAYVQQKMHAAKAPVGSSGSQKVDLRDANNRQRLMAEAIDAGRDSP